jgi:hypothetical protein
MPPRRVPDGAVRRQWHREFLEAFATEVFLAVGWQSPKPQGVVPVLLSLDFIADEANAFIFVDERRVFRTLRFPSVIPPLLFRIVSAP